MTSSNHKPYTYPENIIDIPPGEDIRGSMKYLDESLRRFLAEAKTVRDEHSAAIELSEQLVENLETSPLYLKIRKLI